jgi:N-acyl-D-amino-acid deacylase
MPEFYRRLRSLGVTCEEAVKRMTSLPAGRFEICLRGELKKGYFADVAVWKENEFSSRSTYSKPHAFSSGMQYVIVNGKISYRSGRFTDNRGGRFLERRKK